MLQASQLYKNFGLVPILQDINFTINSGDHCGLVGINGTGKTTLLKILVGKEKANKGSINFYPKNLRIGYLPQGLVIDDHSEIGSFLGSEFGEISVLDQKLAQLSESLAKKPDDTAGQIEFDLLLNQIHQATEMIHQAPTLMKSLGLGEYDLSTLISQLSGGQKTRLMLVKVLMTNPQILLLDEPTNHLDIKMIEWLESWINQFQGGILMVSHDRTFLDRTVNGILELDEHTHQISFYSGNYSDYLEQKIVKHEKQYQAFQDKQIEIHRLQSAAMEMRSKAKYRKGGKTDPSKTDGFSVGFFGDRTKETIQKAKNIEKRVEKIMNNGVEKPVRTWQMKVDFHDVQNSGRNVLILDNLSVGYGSNDLINEISLILRFGERVALIGDNGCGKTSLIKTIFGEIPAIGGNFRLGTKVKIGYMSQEQDEFDPDYSVIETIRKVFSHNETENRKFLSKFLFKGDDVFKIVGKLSFGERARLSLACLVAQGCNFLILDEPINHLDIPSRTQFEKALSEFEGTVLAIVHDRYFIDGFATQIWEVKNKQIMTREKL
ncbi:MAG: ABC-F family ATP-binding cassette domain-containing protein [Anaerolineaceae bacterium]|nr:ABC-F family ATP-binding cassette domain-containing protein [Anaerolineaceae bacterium]